LIVVVQWRGEHAIEKSANPAQSTHAENWRASHWPDRHRIDGKNLLNQSGSKKMATAQKNSFVYYSET
jgi:hypothetical protein